MSSSPGVGFSLVWSHIGLGCVWLGLGWVWVWNLSSMVGFTWLHTHTHTERERRHGERKAWLAVSGFYSVAMMPPVLQCGRGIGLHCTFPPHFWLHIVWNSAIAVENSLPPLFPFHHSPFVPLSVRSFSFLSFLLTLVLVVLQYRGCLVFPARAR